ncbi:MAG: pilus assembly protein CpaF [Actinomycetota bacterium]|jgi:pilus assembly protein CpaF|nr:pilus assembly protein CpaF [Actinomycetota bacterium]
MSALEPALVERVRRRVVSSGEAPTPGRVAAAFQAEGGGLRGDAAGVVAALTSEIVGTGPLAALLADPATTDVLVNAPDEVWVDRGDGLLRTAVRFADENAVRRLAQRLAASSGRRLDDAQPWVDARLPGGVRLHAVLPPLAPGGTCVSLRVPRRRVFSLAELVDVGSVPPDGAALLEALVRSRIAFLVTGGTGTGKTTVLSALLSLIGAERLVVVEDACELRPAVEHIVRLEARPPNVEGTGGVRMHELVRLALRMRPDRLVVGEVRGAEVVDLLAALNTGHEGGCGTLHANSAADVPARLEALAASAGMGRDALHSQLASALRVVVHLARPAGIRRVAEVCLLGRGGDGLVASRLAWSWDGAAAAGLPGSAAAELAGLLG